MKKSICALIALSIVPSGCASEAVAGGGQEVEGARTAPSIQVAGLIRKEMPAEDPGPPYYARLGIQFYVDDGVLAIPFYRPPECVPADFNLLQFFHFPGPEGPGALGCPMVGMDGFLLIEPDAPTGTFPKKAELKGEDIPIWFVDFGDFEEATEDGILTLADLEALSPVRGVATSYAETLQPREGEHEVVIHARGEADGRHFTMDVTDILHDARQVDIVWTERGR